MKQSAGKNGGGYAKRRVVLTLIDVQPSQQMDFTRKLRRYLKLTLRAYGWKCTQLKVEEG